MAFELAQMQVEEAPAAKRFDIYDSTINRERNEPAPPEIVTQFSFVAKLFLP